MTSGHAPDDMRIIIHVEALSTPADQAFAEAIAEHADDDPWRMTTGLSVLEGAPVTDIRDAMSLAKQKASSELLFGSSTAVAIPSVLPDYGQAWVFVWFGWK